MWLSLDVNDSSRFFGIEFVFDGESNGFLNLFSCLNRITKIAIISPTNMSHKNAFRVALREEDEEDDLPALERITVGVTVMIYVGSVVIEG